MSKPILRTSGPRIAEARGSGKGGRVIGSLRPIAGVMALTGVMLLAGCLYSFRAGSGFPPHIRTIAVLPFENETTRFEISNEIHQAMLREVPRALGVNQAGEEVADAIVRGTVQRYSLDAPLFRTGPDQRAEVLQRQVSIGISVEIVDVRDNVVLWEDRNLSALGQYLEASQNEDVGREEAIKRLVQLIIDGAQSNW